MILPCFIKAWSASCSSVAAETYTQSLGIIFITNTTKGLAISKQCCIPCKPQWIDPHEVRTQIFSLMLSVQVLHNGPWENLELREKFPSSVIRFFSFISCFLELDVILLMNTTEHAWKGEVKGSEKQKNRRDMAFRPHHWNISAESFTNKCESTTTAVRSTIQTSVI